MSAESTRTLAYLCPACHRSVVIERSLFQLSAAPNTLPCPCGKSALQVTLEGSRASLTVPCAFCGHEHTVSCSGHAFLHEKALAFSCAASGLDCCYVGEEGAVFQAMKRLEEAADKLERREEQRGTFLDELVMHEVLSELKDIAARGGIFCTCGCREWKLEVLYSAVVLRCPQCGGKLRLGAATASDIDDICCKNTLTIQGRR